MNEFKNQQDILFNDLIQKQFIRRFQEGEYFDQNATLELDITPECNQKCTYCYLQKHGDELYPKALRNHTLIINNLYKLLNFILKNNLIIPNLDLYSGEIWGTDFGLKILNILLDYVKNKNLKIYHICIPSNMSFILSDTALNYIQKYVDEFKSHGITLNFSASVDGKVIEEFSRPFSNSIISKNIKNNDFYWKLFDVCIKNNWGFHPMVDANTIDLWIKNYQWWVNQFKTHNIYTKDYWYGHLMFLEVRDNNWTDEKILQYILFLNYAFDSQLSTLWENNLNEFITERIFRIFQTPNNQINYAYSALHFLKREYKMNCSAGNSTIIRLGDLAIIPCHRTSYEKLIYGYFNTDENEIIGISANNIQLFNAIVFQGSKLMFKCDSCVLDEYCVKGCLGAQLEDSGEIFYPIESVCELNFAKYIYLYLKLSSISFIDKPEFNSLKDLIQNIKKYNLEVFNKWKAQIENML